MTDKDSTSARCMKMIGAGRLRAPAVSGCCPRRKLDRQSEGLKIVAMDNRVVGVIQQSGFQISSCDEPSPVRRIGFRPPSASYVVFLGRPRIHLYEGLQLGCLVEVMKFDLKPRVTGPPSRNAWNRLNVCEQGYRGRYSHHLHGAC